MSLMGWLLWGMLTGCGGQAPVSFPTIEAAADLSAHTREFDREIVKVTDGVYVAVGYGLANSVLLEGDEAVVVVDALESVETATVVREAFRGIVDKPVAALIYTHNHADHILGAEAFGGPDLPVYAHASTSAAIDRMVNVLRPVIARRSLRMLGPFLDDAALINCGIGRRIELQPDSTLGVLRPNHTFEERLAAEVAGIRFELVHAPGETDDQLFIWLPEKRVLLCGDNFYKAFPNLYTIRGTPYRDVTRWVDSLDRMRALRPAYLVPGHTRPLSGAAEIERVLTDYRDAIQFVHDQTIRGMNRGLGPGELAEQIRLPPHLANSPYLQEFYGTVAWSVRGIFDGYLGWYGGNPSELFPLARAERAAHMAALAGGAEALAARARQAMTEGHHQWALELTDHLCLLEGQREAAVALRIEALKALGEAAANPNARHTYLAVAAELRNDLDLANYGKPTVAMVHAFPMARLFQAMAVNLDAEASAEMDKRVGFIFSDSGEQFTIHVRRGVAEIQPRLDPNCEVTVKVKATIWKEMMARMRSPVVTVASHCDIEGGTLDLVRFLRLFQPPQ